MSATNKTKRINPNRVFEETDAGIKRIKLSAPEIAEHPQVHKELRAQMSASKVFLAIAHSERGMLDDHARQAIAAAAILAKEDTEVVALVMGALNEDLANLGVDNIIVMPALDYQIFQPDVELECVLKLVEKIKPTRIFFPDNQIGDGELGRRLIANQPSKSAATHVVEINENHVVSYHTGGSLMFQSDMPEILLLAHNSVDTHLPFTSTAKINEHINAKTLKPEIVNSPFSDKGMQAITATSIALEEADFIVSAGNGVKNVTTLEVLAKSLDAAIGASRVAVDEGNFSRDKQIGASGKTVNASVYLAIGISGAVQHLQGIKDCRHVIAINRDSSAPIVKRADLTIVGDAEEIMQSLIKAISEAKLAKQNGAV